MIQIKAYCDKCNKEMDKRDYYKIGMSHTDIEKKFIRTFEVCPECFLLIENFIKESEMKIRQGFVSNSSTSSFVLIGFKPKEIISSELLEKLQEEMGYEEDDDGGIIIGNTIMTIHDDDYEMQSIPYLQVEDIINETLKDIKEYFPNVTKDDLNFLRE